MKPGDFPGRSWALLFARLVLGLIFFMAGFWKVFQLGPLQHARKYFLPFADTFLPVWSLWAAGVVIPFIELIAGGLVIVGLRTREALIALGFVLAIVTRSEEHTSELQSPYDLVCRLLLEKKK